MHLFFQFWRFWLLPIKLYGSGGGGTNITEFVNPEQRELAAIADEKWAEYKRKYIPMENDWIKQAKSMDSNAYHQQAANLASNEVIQQYGSQTGKFGAGLAGGGNPNIQGYLNMAGDASQATNKANLGVTDRYLKGLGNVIAMGQGQSTDAISGLADVANTSVQAQMDRANYQNQMDQDSKTTTGMVAGGLMGGLTNYKTVNKLVNK